MSGESEFLKWVEQNYADGYMLELGKSAIFYAGEQGTGGYGVVEFLEEECVAIQAMIEKAKRTIGVPWPQASKPGTSPVGRIMEDYHY